MDKNIKILFLAVGGLMLGLINNTIFGSTICQLVENTKVITTMGRIVIYLSFTGIVIFVISAILLIKNNIDIFKKN